MSSQDVDRAREVLRAKIDDLRAAWTELATAVAELTDYQAAFEQATQAGDEVNAAMRDLSNQVAEIRAKMATLIWETDELSLAELAERIGTSKARADQLVRTATGRPTPRRKSPKAKEADS